jgi:myxalamid-type nonribosomal peptide synthetase MxaA
MDNASGLPTPDDIRSELLRLMGEALGEELPSVPGDTPILDLVASSLALVDGMRRIFERFGVLVSIRRVLEGQATLNGIAALIEQQLSAPRVRKGDSTSSEAESGAAAATRIRFAPSQRHIGFLARYSSDASSAFNEAVAVRLEGPLGVPALQVAIAGIADRYEALRTSLSPDEDQLDVHPQRAFELPVSACRAGELDEKLAEIIRRPFPPGHRLFRAGLLRESEARHVLVLVSHRLVVDAEALQVILEDLAAFYSAYEAGREPDAGFPALQWPDYLAMGQAAAARDAREAAEAYWTGALSEAWPQLDLPSDSPRPPVKRYAGARAVMPLDPGLCERAGSWSGLPGPALPSVLFGAFTAYLSRLSGLRDVVVGVRSGPLYLDSGQRVAAQTRNMLPVRVIVDPEQTFEQHLRASAAAVDRAERNRHLSLAELIQLANLPRDQSRSPLFVAAFQRQDSPALPAFGTLRVSRVQLPAAGAPYDIELSVATTPDGTSLVVDYSTELFEAATIDRWTRGMLTLLQAALDDPAARCGALPVMTPAESRTLLVDWNRTDTDYPRDRTVLDLFEEQASARPDSPAVRCRDAVLTYRQLAGRVDELAAWMSGAGVVAGDRVAILLERNPDLIAALLASWKVGALYVPLDRAFPIKRLAYMLADAGVSTCVTSLALSPLVRPGFDGNVIEVDAPGGHPAPLVAASTQATAAQSAYLIYTSGSTGQPKGVEVGHRGLLNVLLSIRERVRFEAGDSLMAITTVSFDIATVELLMPLVAGGVVDVVPDGVVADGVALAATIASRAPDFMQATPSIWKAVLAAGWQGDKKLRLASGGEGLSRELAEQLLPKVRELWNLYGPTETTVWSTASNVQSAPGQPISVGRPVANTQLYILDEARRSVPLGAVGELYIGGDGLACGYWERPELTAERFVENPFRTGSRLYRTGDLARYAPNGDVICLGRVDDQVKVHGVRMELAEVEAALRSVAGVRDAVVTAWRDGRGDMQLVGHVVTDRPTPSAAAIRAELRQHLPDVMIPPHIRFTDAFPMTANGKIRRAALPGPDLTADQALPTSEAPETPTERLLAEAWSRILELEIASIGRDSDFMDLGGHSLLMTPLMVEVRKLFQVTFSLREFFDAPTIRSLGTLIAERRQEANASRPDSRTSTPARGSDWGRQRMATLKREAELPPNLAPVRGMTYRPPSAISTVLLTGATGFLGAYLIANILRTTSAHVYCLVRPKRGHDGRSRIEKQMRNYAVWPGDESWLAEWRSRLHVVEGDVTLPRLGMADRTYDMLAREVDAIVHGAAHVNFIYPYEALRATNVLGVHEIIRFAFDARIKPVHHLSTAAIWPMGAQFTFYEKDPIEHGQVLNLGYDEAKWVGERCLLHAAERGLPVARYRPGEVGGDSVSGRSVTDHFLTACVRGFLQFGAFPVLDIEVDVAPVDYVARAMTHLVFRQNSIGGAFHLTNPSRLHMSQALSFLRSLGYRFEELPFEVLRDRLISSRSFASNALFAYQAALQEMDDVSLQLPTYDTRETDRALRGSGIVCPPADEKLFGVYLKYLLDIGVVPQPEGVASPI